jgi:hypothetical protein
MGTKLYKVGDEVLVNEIPGVCEFTKPIKGTIIKISSIFGSSSVQLVVNIQLEEANAHLYNRDELLDNEYWYFTSTDIVGMCFGENDNSNYILPKVKSKYKF